MLRRDAKTLPKGKMIVDLHTMMRQRAPWRYRGCGPYARDGHGRRRHRRDRHDRTLRKQVDAFESPRPSETGAF